MYLQPISYFLLEKADALLKDYCKDRKINISGSKTLSEAFNDIDRVSVTYASKYMCSLQCPCSTSIDLSRWNETKLNLYNRTKVLTSTTRVIPNIYHQLYRFHSL